ncbi:MAG: hypothetical protein KDE24_06220 [Caldilinea sp.]|nr:hypothetical protein [Caldilinea sp.]
MKVYAQLDGISVTTYGYDGWGNLIQETVNGVTTEFVLDENTAYTRILGEVRSDGGERGGFPAGALPHP